MKVLTEADLRRERLQVGRREYRVDPDVFVTPSAREYLRDCRVELIVNSEETGIPKTEDGVMTRDEPVGRDRGVCYVDAVTGEEYMTKPEGMTHIRGRLLVRKTHPRIRFRGKLDALQAQVVLLQARFPEQRRLCEDLDDVRQYISAILGAEVKDSPPGDLRLFGLEAEEIREMSHNVRKYFGMEHQIPRASMGAAALELNLLRTKVREAELDAAEAFQDGDELEIIRHLNRLSSGIYILFCRMISGYYNMLSKKEEE